MTTVILGLGSNVGDKLSYLKRATDALRPLLAAMRVSSIYQSDALLPDAAPDSWNQPFLNMAVVGESILSADELLPALKTIERKLGRQDRGRWSPREIDIDILAMGNLACHSPHLTIPHNELLKRDFALVPLAELYPHWVMPSGEYKGKTAVSLVKQFGYQLHCHRKKTKVVGILNITPDSFSDGGLYVSAEKALKHMEALIVAGADVIDIGAESTRPGATPLSFEEEWERLAPVLGALPDSSVAFSIDTRHAQTASRALAHGVQWINDVSGFSDLAMVEAVRKANCTLVAMHSLSVPADKQVTFPESVDVIEELRCWIQNRKEQLGSQGIASERLIFDPGIGFGKTAAQSWKIVECAKKLGDREVILIGHSRKSFLQQSGDRDAATLVVSQSLIAQGVEYVRVHEVAAHTALCEKALYG